MTTKEFAKEIYAKTHKALTVSTSPKEDKLIAYPYKLTRKGKKYKIYDGKKELHAFDNSEDAFEAFENLVVASGN